MALLRPPAEDLVETLRAFALELQQLTVETPGLWRAELRVGGIQVTAEQRIDRERKRFCELIGWFELLETPIATRCALVIQRGREHLAGRDEQRAAS